MGVAGDLVGSRANHLRAEPAVQGDDQLPAGLAFCTVEIGNRTCLLIQHILAPSLSLRLRFDIELDNTCANVRHGRTIAVVIQYTIDDCEYAACRFV